MTIRELIQGVGQWFTGGYDTLSSQGFMELTIGQALFTIVVTIVVGVQVLVHLGEILKALLAVGLVVVYAAGFGSLITGYPEWQTELMFLHVTLTGAAILGALILKRRYKRLDEEQGRDPDSRHYFWH
ncbi:MAG: hypothetical protein ABJL54_16080 [Halioglobus sp.]